MESVDHIAALAALAHPRRLSVFRLLARRAPEAVRASEVAAALDLKPNTLSVYVSALERAGLIRGRRDGRSIYYSIDLERTGALVDYLVADCCRGRSDLCAPRTARALAQQPMGDFAMPDRVFNVLFICTGNSARSIFAEALLAEIGAERFRAFSAGTKPFSELHPFAIEVLRQTGHDVSGLRAKNISSFQGADAPKMDFVFTVCDQAANEDCPPWPGQPVTAHWGQPDPVKVTGTDAEKALAFKETYRQMRQRILSFTSLRFEALDRFSLQNAVDAAGQAGAPQVPKAEKG